MNNFNHFFPFASFHLVYAHFIHSRRPFVLHLQRQNNIDDASDNHDQVVVPFLVSSLTSSSFPQYLSNKSSFFRFSSCPFSNCLLVFDHTINRTLVWITQHWKHLSVDCSNQSPLVLLYRTYRNSTSNIGRTWTQMAKWWLAVDVWWWKETF